MVLKYHDTAMYQYIVPSLVCIMICNFLFDIFQTPIEICIVVLVLIILAQTLSDQTDKSAQKMLSNFYCMLCRDTFFTKIGLTHVHIKNLTTFLEFQISKTL